MLGLLLAAVESPTLVVDRAFEAMGGRENLAHIQKLTEHRDGHVNALEQSERPEGPYFVTYTSTECAVDFQALKIDVKSHQTGLLDPGGYDSQVSFSFKPTGQPVTYGYEVGLSVADMRMRLALGPERLLFTALQAKDLRLGRSEVFHGIEHDVLSFTWGYAPVRVYLNHYTHLPSAVETVQPLDGFWSAWGDVRTRVMWGNYDLAPTGLLLPTLWTIERNGLLHESYSTSGTKLATSAAEALSGLSLPKPHGVRTMPFTAVEVAPGIVQYQGGFNSAVVDQGDGLVFLEGVYSSGTTEAILADAAKRFPGKPVKAVVASDDAWPHIAGLRTFVARKVPIYAPPENLPILRRLARAPFRTVPDALARTAASPIFVAVTKPITLGSGPNRLILRPMHGSVTERMLYGEFPERKIVYAPDVIQTDGKQWYNVNLIQELLQALDRDHVSADTTFAVHSGPIPIPALREVLSKNRP